MRIRNTPDRPATDAELVVGLLALVNGSAVAVDSQRPQQNAAALAGQYKVTLTKAARHGSSAGNPGTALDEHFKLGEWAVDTLPNLRRTPHAFHRGGQWLIKWHTEFRDLRAALDYALTLVLSPDEPYLTKLCRCSYSECDRVYLAEKNPKGGPANTVYCSDVHRTLANNSANRKTGDRKRPRTTR
jgi:hypothetical protein